MAASSFLCSVLRRVLTPWLRMVKRADLRAALMADLVLAMDKVSFEPDRNPNARGRVKGNSRRTTPGAPGNPRQSRGQASSGPQPEAAGTPPANEQASSLGCHRDGSATSG